MHLNTHNYNVEVVRVKLVPTRPALANVAARLENCAEAATTVDPHNSMKERNTLGFISDRKELTDIGNLRGLVIRSLPQGFLEGLLARYVGPKSRLLLWQL
jgi:hypothetical protein